MRGGGRVERGPLRRLRGRSFSRGAEFVVVDALRSWEERRWNCGFDAIEAW